MAAAVRAQHGRHSQEPAAQAANGQLPKARAAVAVAEAVYKDMTPQTVAREVCMAAAAEAALQQCSVLAAMARQVLSLLNIRRRLPQPWIKYRLCF